MTQFYKKLILMDNSTKYKYKHKKYFYGCVCILSLFFEYE